jgi:hypothetical protein
MEHPCTGSFSVSRPSTNSPPSYNTPVTSRGKPRDITAAIQIPAGQDDFLFGRRKELEELRQRFSNRESFVLHGLSGAGKTYLIRHVIGAFPNVLYCPDSSTGQPVFHDLITALLTAKDRRVRRSIHNRSTLRNKSTMTLRGIALEALREGKYTIVLDHLQGPGAGFSSDIRDIMFYGGTPVVAVGRSPHMEDLGFLTPMFVVRSDQMELHLFGRVETAIFASEMAERTHLTATNLTDFLDRIATLSHGSPGAVMAMVQMATRSKYRIGGHIKTSPLYIDFRLAWHAANAW